MNKDIVKNLVAAIETQDSDAIGQLFADDIVFENISENNIIHGCQAVQKKFSDFFQKASKIHWDIQRKIFEENTIVIEKNNNVCMDGKNLIIPMVSIIEVKNGKIIFFKEYFDSQSLVRQLNS